jgi:hypothetical protein
MARSRAKHADDVQTEPRRGRPAGSPNREYDQALEIPAACPNCGSVNLTKIEGSKDICQTYAGEIRGFLYREIIRTRKKCSDCLHLTIVRRYVPQN